MEGCCFVKGAMLGRAALHITMLHLRHFLGEGADVGWPSLKPKSGTTHHSRQRKAVGGMPRTWEAEKSDIDDHLTLL